MTLYRVLKTIDGNVGVYLELIHEKKSGVTLYHK